VNSEKVKWRRENNDFCRERGEAPAAWLLEGATQAPVIAEMLQMANNVRR
jgi:hypothetical protein